MSVNINDATSAESWELARTPEERITRMRAIASEIAALPVLDAHSPEDMLYDEFALPE